MHISELHLILKNTSKIHFVSERDRPYICCDIYSSFCPTRGRLIWEDW